MKSGSVQVILFALICIVSLAVVYAQNKNATKKMLVKALREKVLILFMEAEKLDIIGAEKMKWVAHKIHKLLPDLIEPFIKEQSIENWLQEFYNETRELLKTEKIDELIAPKEVESK